MKWSLEYGHKDRLALFKKLEMQGRETPLSRMPDLSDNEIWYFEIFEFLSRFRPPSTAGVAPISLNDLYLYMDRNIIPGSQREFLSVITTLDGIYREWVIRNSQKQNG